MAPDRKTRDVQADLRMAGFHPTRSDGSHTWWKHECGVAVSVPDGHRMISPGVWTKIVKAITEAHERS